MIKLLLDLLNFLMGYAPLIMNLVLFTGLIYLLADSIKKHAYIYYIIFSIPTLMTIIQFFGLYSFRGIPVLGQILGANVHMSGFGFPLLIIIMYMGALNIKKPWVKKFMNIRKELSIISGFPVIAHSLIRVPRSFPNALQYFTNNAEYMEGNTRVQSELGVGISNFGLVLGIVMVVLFLILWVTSFDSVRKSMGGRRWKQIQKWSYALYAMLFIHSISLSLGGFLNRGGFGAENTEMVIRQCIAMSSVTLIFGSYLIFRLRKAKQGRLRRTEASHDI